MKIKSVESVFITRKTHFLVFAPGLFDGLVEDALVGARAPDVDAFGSLFHGCLFGSLTTISVVLCYRLAIEDKLDPGHVVHRCLQS